MAEKIISERVNVPFKEVSEEHEEEQEETEEEEDLEEDLEPEVEEFTEFPTEPVRIIPTPPPEPAEEETLEEELENTPTTPAGTRIEETEEPPKTCKDNFDCPPQMKCDKDICVDVGCLNEGEAPPGAINPEYKEHMATECCEGLKKIEYSGNYDDNCNWNLLEGNPSGMCANCGNEICGPGETKCNCPEDCPESKTESFS